jgi:hypothetical protein
MTEVLAQFHSHGVGLLQSDAVEGSAHCGQSISGVHVGVPVGLSLHESGKHVLVAQLINLSRLLLRLTQNRLLVARELILSQTKYTETANLINMNQRLTPVYAYSSSSRQLLAIKNILLYNTTTTI